MCVCVCRVFARLLISVCMRERFVFESSIQTCREARDKAVKLSRETRRDAVRHETTESGGRSHGGGKHLLSS